MRIYSTAVTCLAGLSFLWGIGLVQKACGDETQGSALLESLLSVPTQPALGNTAPRRMPEPSGPPAGRERLSVGINYTGGQARWNFSPRWAVEGRYQQGAASSNEGDVTAHVFGIRGYRFLHSENRFPFYGGAEAAYATAKPGSSSYKTNGMALGIFGGLEYRVTRRILFDMDLGPYVISLTETQTHTSSTNLDFVLNTALLMRIF